MVKIAVDQLADATGARVVARGAHGVCRGCVIDSREVSEGNVFVAFPGERVDGNAFAPKAIDAGAGCVVMTVEPASDLIERARVAGCALMVADDPTEFLLRFAAWYRERLGALVVGITGSIGKTTTKDVMTALLSRSWRVHATKGNYNNLIGLPLTVLSAPADTQVMVLEMGMNHFHEIDRLSACARPNLAVITKVGTSHIGILGSRENIARAKSEIISGMAPFELGGVEHAPVLVLHGEDDFAAFIEETFARPSGIEVLRCGSSASDAVRAEGVELDECGYPHFTLTFEQGDSMAARVAVPGAQSVPNALFAVAVAGRLGVGSQAVVDALGSLSMTGRRVQVRHAASGARIVDDSYNASAESMAAGLDLVSMLPCKGSRIAILGEMGEMGDEAPRMHALVGSYVAAKKFSMLICVGGDLAREMASAARLMGMDDGDIQVVADTDRLIERFADLLDSSDLALVKGSRSVGLDRYVEEVCADVR